MFRQGGADNTGNVVFGGLAGTQAGAPGGAAADPIGKGRDVLGGELGPGGHLRVAFVADGAYEDAALGIAGDDGGAARAAFEQAVAVEERDSSVLEVLVVTG